MKKFLSLLLVIAMMACCIPLVSAETADVPGVPTKEGVGMNLANFDTTDNYGNPVDGSIFQNAELTLINYWATWCGPCVSEMPYIQNLHEYYSGTAEADVQILGVISEGGGCTIPGATAFLEQNGYTYTNLRADSVLRSVFNTSGYIPQTLIVDSNGIVRDHIIGGMSLQDFQQVIDTWLDVFRNHEGEEVTVSYVNGVTGETFATQSAIYGMPLELEYPEVPEVEGYDFASWSVGGANIYESGYEDITYIAMGDITVTANFNAARYKVRFYDGVTNTIINIQTVTHGDAATAPNHPEHEGYTFTGWDADFSCVTSDMNIYGICVPDVETLPGDINGDGFITMADALTIARVALNLEQVEDPMMGDIDGDGNITVADALTAARVALGLL